MTRDEVPDKPGLPPGLVVLRPTVGERTANRVRAGFRMRWWPREAR